MIRHQLFTEMDLVPFESVTPCEVLLFLYFLTKWRNIIPKHSKQKEVSYKYGCQIFFLLFNHNQICTIPNNPQDHVSGHRNYALVLFRKHTLSFYLLYNRPMGPFMKTNNFTPVNRSIYCIFMNSVHVRLYSYWK